MDNKVYPVARSYTLLMQREDDPKKNFTLD